MIVDLIVNRSVSPRLRDSPNEVEESGTSRQRIYLMENETNEST